MSNVLFVCLHNAGRSQISEAFFDGIVSGNRHRARSAGTAPAAAMHPRVVEVMAELGIDLSARTPTRLTREQTEWADVVVTMGCGDACPYIPGKRYLDWQLQDPSGQSAEAVRGIREEIRRRVEALVDDLDSATGG